jgi:tetratricopeptide (TPR) repeat protein
LGEFSDETHLLTLHLPNVQTFYGQFDFLWHRNTALSDKLLARHEWDQAEELLRISLNEVTENKIQRGIIAIRIKLIAIYLEQNKLEAAAAALQAISQLASENLDRQYMAFIQSYYARLYTLQNDLPAARAAYNEAIDLFERLGMRRELKQVRAGLESLDREQDHETNLPHLP